jgi:murein L,D-transpeptidase YafK
MKLISSLLIALTIAATAAKASDSLKFHPSNIYMMDEKFSHHIILVEKSTHQLYLYKNNKDSPTLLKVFKSLTGKFPGDKLVQGDRKTPEGIYFLNFFNSKEYLMKRYGDYGKIYGAGAFTSNYPNLIDRRDGKTGGGIWLHSTDDDNRILKGLDSRGCVVVAEEDLKEISQYVDLTNTTMIVTEDLRYLNAKTWNTKKTKLTNFITAWSTAWQNKDFETYINSYDKERFHSSTKGSYSAYKNYKRAVFSRADKPVIKFTNISIMGAKEYVIVQMQQDYISDIIQDSGKKILYLQKDKNYNWRIVAEKWSRLDKEIEDLSFTPSMRFFTSEKTEITNKTKL